MSDWKQERRIDRGRFEVVIDLNERTEERRVAVYKGETLVAIEFIKPITGTLDRLMEDGLRTIKPVFRFAK